MLQQIRKTFADSIILRIFLGAIIVSFIVWGVNDMLKAPSYGDMATFDDLSPITYQDFAKERALTLKRIQQDSNTPLNEDQIDNAAINNSIMQNLITNKLIAYLAGMYDMHFSDNVAVNFIKTLDVFMGDNNEFNPEKFKQIIKSEGYTESEYSDEIKSMITRGTIMSSLVGNVYLPNARINNIISHMSEVRTLDMASISIPKASVNVTATDQELESFYKENKDMFKTEELRDICYATITKTNTSSGAIVSEEEINNFYNENKSDFKNQSLNNVKSQIRDALMKQKADAGLLTLSKILVDDVAGGANLNEIVDKYSLKKKCEKNITPNNIETRAEGLFVNFTEQISEMAEKDLSYPLELPDQSGFVMLEITKLSPERIKEFNEVKNEVATKYSSFVTKQKLLEKLQNIASANDTENFVKNASAIGMNVETKTYIRAELYDNISLPYEMLSAIFASNGSIVTGPFVSDDKVYVFSLKKVGYDEKTKKRLTKDARGNIMSKLQESVFEEITSYAQKASNMKLKTNPKEFGKQKEE